jgi:predicted PurR-regulated permease PerM
MSSTNEASKSHGVSSVGPRHSARANLHDLGRILPLNVSSLALSGILLLLILYTLKIASTILIPIILALLLNFLFASVIRGLGRFHVPAPLGAVVVLLALLGSLSFGIYKLAEPARGWMAEFPETVRQVERKLRGVKQSVQEVTKATKEVDRLTTLDDSEKNQKVQVKKSTLGESLLGPTQEFLVGTGLVLALLFFLLSSGDLFLRKLVGVLPSLHDKKLAV